jgi:uncharacterized protein YgfB (UPF0149 family)
MTMAKRKSKASHGNDVLDDLLKVAARKNDLDDDKELLVRAANEIARLRALALNVIKEPPAFGPKSAPKRFL